MGPLGGPKGALGAPRGPLGPWGPKSSETVGFAWKHPGQKSVVGDFVDPADGGRRAVAPTLTPLVSTHPPKIAIPLLGGIRGAITKIPPWALMGRIIEVLLEMQPDSVVN